jgi:molybdopterin molybdotransferase
MLLLEQAQDQIRQAVRACATVETVPLAQALHRFVAEPLRAQVANPAFDNSAMDGYAVATADLVAAGFRLPLRGESSCGDAPATLARATTMRIFTGAPLPAGADAVVIQEDIHIDGDHVVFPHTVRPGQNIRHAGEDFAAGTPLYGTGRRLHARDIALLSAAGIATVAVFKRPRVLVFATGNELVSPGQALRPGQIYESNRLATLLQLQQLGADAVDGGTVADDETALHAALDAAGDYDFVITSGGVSVGDHDLVKRVFAERGEIDFWKVRIKPGKPVAFGRLGTRGHFVGLPGNPVSSLVTFKLFVEPALLAWSHAPYAPLQLQAIAANGFRRHAGRTEFLRARLHAENGALTVEVLQGQGSHMLGTLRNTNALARVEHDSTGFDAGAAVTVLPLDIV